MVAPLSLFQNQQGDLGTLSFQPHLGMSPVWSVLTIILTGCAVITFFFLSDSLAILNSKVAESKNDS